MQETSLRGSFLLNHPALNRSTAFTEEERTSLGLHGLLPPIIETLEQQCVRAYEAYKRKPDDLERHIYLRALQDTNETLFYALLYRNMAEMTPIVYNPGVAQGCINFSHIYRRPRGLFLSYPLAHRLEEMLDNRPHERVDVIVVTDGERVLGIGDQGAGGMGISIGKLSLYTLMGGINPLRTLPILLDVGTNNLERLSDPEYIGWRHERITGKAYEDFIDLFVSAVKKKLPNVLLQWEDFSKMHARPILERYRDSICSFNDDIQGTAAVAVGALYGALRVTGKRFSEQIVVVLGAGSAATGIAEYILAEMSGENLSESEALKRFYILDSGGLVHMGRKGLSAIQQKFAQPVERIQPWKNGENGKIGLQEVIANISATILIGTSTKPGAFSEPIVREMARKIERPIIFPLSNPDTQAEARPADLIHWTNGKALVATGAPFPPVSHNGKSFKISQCNNFYIFPAIGLAVTASNAGRVTDRMLLAAARELGRCAAEEPETPLLPSLSRIREVSRRVAVAVGEEARKAGLARVEGGQELSKLVARRFWLPEYNIPSE